MNDDLGVVVARVISNDQDAVVLAQIKQLKEVGWAEGIELVSGGVWKMDWQNKKTASGEAAGGAAMQESDDTLEEID